MADLIRLSVKEGSQSSRQIAKNIEQSAERVKSSRRVLDMDTSARAKRYAELRDKYRPDGSYVENSRSNYRSFNDFVSPEARAARRPKPKVAPQPTGNARVDAFNRRVAQAREPKSTPRTAEEIKKSYKESRSRERKEARESNLRKREAERIASSQAFLDGANQQKGLLPTVAKTSKTLLGSMVNNLSEEGALKRAGIGIFQSAGVGGVTSAGMAYLQGEDPWEAAKTGMFKGAMVGAGYQGLKAATHASSTKKGIKGIMDNTKQIGRGVRDTYSVHTVRGNAAMRQNGMSDQLKTIMRANELSKTSIAANGLYGGRK